jgi:hypothetical protein
MATVGFAFTKISAERKPVNAQNVNIESNASVSNVTELPGIDPKKALLKFEFDFTVKYEPGVGRIELKGEVIELYDKELGTKITGYWNSDKKVYVEIMQDLFNNILSRSNVESVVISRDLGLPSPVQMPRVDVKSKSMENKDAKAEPKAEKPENRSERAKK